MTHHCWRFSRISHRHHYDSSLLAVFSRISHRHHYDSSLLAVFSRISHRHRYDSSLLAVFSRISQPHPTPIPTSHAPCALLYLAAMLIGGWLGLGIRCCGQFGAAGTATRCGRAGRTPRGATPSASAPGTPTGYVTFRADFHHFDRFELDLRGHIHVWSAAFSCVRLKLADIVLI